MPQNNLQRDLQTMAVRYRWAYEELVVDAKMIEWNMQCSNRPRADDDLFEIKKQEAISLFDQVSLMYAYLVGVYGSGIQVLTELNWIVRAQSGRRKTLCLNLD